MTRGLIFDLDGTLVDSLPGIAASLNHALAQQGREAHELPAVRRFIGNGSLELARRALGPGSSPELAKRVEAAFKRHYEVHWPAGTVPYPGIVAALETLAASGARLGVLSNKPHPFTVEIVARLFPGIPFDPVFGQQENVPRKPDPAAALHIAQGWDLAPADCRFIGDSLVDLETSHRAGMPFIGVSWGYHEAAELTAAGARWLVTASSALASADRDF